MNPALWLSQLTGSKDPCEQDLFTCEYRWFYFFCSTLQGSYYLFLLYHTSEDLQWAVTQM